MNKDIDDCDYSLIPQKSLFNKFMGEPDEDLTPLKYWLSSDRREISKETHERY